MYFKKLVGKQIYLSPFDIADVEKNTKWMNDEEVTRNIGCFRNMTTVLSETDWISSVLKSGKYNFTIVDIETNESIGNCGIDNVDEANGKATLGIFIGEEVNRGKGVGTEALTLLLDFCFNHLRLHNVDLNVFSFNERAIACYKKCGFKEYGRRTESYFYDGKYYDEIKMEILDRDFKK